MIHAPRLLLNETIERTDWQEDARIVLARLEQQRDIAAAERRVLQVAKEWYRARQTADNARFVAASIKLEDAIADLEGFN